MLSHLSEISPIDIEFDISYSIPLGRKGIKKILRNVSGLFRSGELTAILGPSGAGKSTLLNVLAGYRCLDVTGTVKTNGVPRIQAHFKKVSRYIMQEDMLQENLTTLEYMHIAADLKLGCRLSPEKKLVAIEEILETLRLQNAKNTFTTCLSGGERKRLAVALELIDNPPIIFLDEPTTGLDDLSSSLCVTLLKTLAQGGRTVICSLHTPSARLFSMFDHVYVVAEGQCAFRGKGRDIVPFLSSIGLNCPLHYNPADFVIEASTGQYGQYLDKMTAAAINGDNYRWDPQITSDLHSVGDPEIFNIELPPIDGQHNFDSSFWMQSRILARRHLLQAFRNTSHLLLRIVMNTFLGFVIGGTFYNFGNDGSKVLFNYGFCYVCSVVFLHIPLLPVLLEYPSEVQLMKREYFNRWYSFNSYFFATTIARIPTMILMGTLYFIISFPLTDQPLELKRAGLFFTFCILTGLVSESLGLAVASSLRLVNALFVGSSSSAPLMLLAVYGLGQKYHYIPIIIRLGMMMSYVRYGFEGMVLSVYGFGRAPLHCPKEEGICDLRYPQVLLNYMAMDEADMRVSFAGLIGFFILFRAASYLLLRWRLSNYRSIPPLYYLGQLAKTYVNIR